MRIRNPLRTLIQPVTYTNSYGKTSYLLTKEHLILLGVSGYTRRLLRIHIRIDLHNKCDRNSNPEYKDIILPLYELMDVGIIPSGSYVLDFGGDELPYSFNNCFYIHLAKTF